MERWAGKQFLLTMYVALKRHYPNFQDLLDRIDDPRKRKGYQTCELVMAGLVMFLLRRGSRNAMDTMWTSQLERNYLHVFGMRLPLMDTVDKWLRVLPTGELESLKRSLVRVLLTKKVFDKYRVKGGYLVSVDGSGLYSYDYEPYPGCPYKTSSKGKRSWQCYVLEAKLVCGNGFSISLGSCYLDNEQSLNNKQDCEQKAFLRLAACLHKDYPRLPIILLGDGLYPNQTVFDTCANYGWHYIITLKDGNLPSVWEEIKLLLPLHKGQRAQRTSRSGKQGWLEESVCWLEGIDRSADRHQSHQLNWLEYTKRTEQFSDRFCYVTDLSLDNQKTAWQTAFAGRLRWKIENEGFNVQKNHGMALAHKYSRHHQQAQANYYQLMQIAHLISQLTERLKQVIQAIDDAKTTLKALLQDMTACLRLQPISAQELDHALDKHQRLRY